MSKKERETVQSLDSPLAMIKAIARHNLRKDSLVILRQWWAKKYHSSPKSDEFQRYTLWEMTIEFFEDYYAQDKKRVWKDEREDLGAVELPESGDPLVDRWERQIAEGLEPDLTEGLPEEKRAQIRERAQQIQSVTDAKNSVRESEKLAEMFRNIGSVPDAYKTFSDDYRG
tara:strand:+ start:53 stop:565 length:513 start_codon:yes stop_codon:yes gene_type:complete